MKNILMTRLTALALCCALLLAGCGAKPGSSETPDSSSDGPSVVEPIEGETREKQFLLEKIDQGYIRNSDTVGWIVIPNTNIDQAVLQRNDPDISYVTNLNYYLRIDEDKKHDLFSCYWTNPDSRIGSRDELSKNTVIYGHADYKDTGVGKRFSELFKYNDIEFVKENPYIYFSTDQEDMVWQIFSVFYTHVDFNYIQANPSDAEYTKIIETAKAKSEYLFDVPVTKDDKIITLSTCTGLYNPQDRDNYRYVVMAKLLPTTDVPVGAVEVSKNPNPQK